MNYSVRSDLQSERIEYRHLQCHQQGVSLLLLQIKKSLYYHVVNFKSSTTDHDVILISEEQIIFR